MIHLYVGVSYFERHTLIESQLTISHILSLIIKVPRLTIIIIIIIRVLLTIDMLDIYVI